MRRTVKLTPPSHLDATAKKEFNRIAAELDRMGADIRQVDMALLATYSQSYSDVARITVQIRKEGDTVPGHRGMLRKNPNLSTLRDSTERMLRSAHKLGMSPQSRRNLNLTPPSDPANGLEKFRMK